MDIVDAISKSETDRDDKPAGEVTLERVEIQDD
jgi:hypothetical protein